MLQPWRAVWCPRPRDAWRSPARLPQQPSAQRCPRSLTTSPIPSFLRQHSTLQGVRRGADRHPFDCHAYSRRRHGVHGGERGHLAYRRGAF
jgi:hypothetical protein